MPRPRNNLTDMEIDEISTVDKTANQHSRFVIAKRAPEEEEMPDIYDQEGKALTEDEEEEEPQRELAQVGKSAFFEDKKPQAGSFSAAVLEELSKAFSDKDRDA